MRIIETLNVPSRDGNSRIELLVGDLSAIPREHAVDAVVVSAFPDDYTPTATSLIGAFARKKLSLQSLARRKDADFRKFSSCWLSRPINKPELNFRHVLCFEHAYEDDYRSAADEVGDVFRSLIPLSIGEPWIKSVALPLLAAGDQGESPRSMLHATFQAAVRWLSAGLSLDVVKVVLHESKSEDFIAEAQSALRSYDATSAHHAVASRHAQNFEYDLFVSYSHQDTPVVDDLIARIERRYPEMDVFRDREKLMVGNAWQQRIFNAIDTSQRVLCLYSPSYLESPVCIEEYNCAHLRNREEGDVLVPAYLRSTARLPSYMRLIQYFDVRENDSGRLEALVDELGRKPRGRIARSPSQSTRQPAVPSSEPATMNISISADASAELGRIVDVLITAGREIRFDVRMRGVDTDTA